jgi:hypothetical protein
MQCLVFGLEKRLGTTLAIGSSYINIINSQTGIWDKKIAFKNQGIHYG